VTQAPTRRLALVLEYDGTGFAGSQRQPGRRTVAGVLEEALSRLDAAPVQVALAGRTDAGVHAEGQVAACDVRREWSVLEWTDRLNRLLPGDLVVRAACGVGSDFDPRRAAVRRQYRYRISRRSVRPAIGAGNAWWREAGITAERVRDALACYRGEHDFAGLCLAGPERTVRTIERAELIEADEMWEIWIEARSFLPRQVRFMVGAAVASGEGTIGLEDLQRVLDTGRRDERIVAAPAAGLCLVRVEYDDGVLDGDPVVGVAKEE
jgi:tRNA pseudouridine38-40 synthase